MVRRSHCAVGLVFVSRLIQAGFSAKEGEEGKRYSLSRRGVNCFGPELALPTGWSSARCRTPWPTPARLGTMDDDGGARERARGCSVVVFPTEISWGFAERDQPPEWHKRLFGQAHEQAAGPGNLVGPARLMTIIPQHRVIGNCGVPPPPALFWSGWRTELGIFFSYIRLGGAARGCWPGGCGLPSPSHALREGGCMQYVHVLRYVCTRMGGRRRR